jgi:hypothetical protein
MFCGSEIKTINSNKWIVAKKSVAQVAKNHFYYALEHSGPRFPETLARISLEADI